MNAAVVYFSRTGNTKRFAQAIAETAQAPLYDLESADTSKIADVDLLIFGGPVEGASPTKEALAYLANLPAISGKKAMVFCTYRLFGNERQMKAVEKELAGKGYEVVFKFSKKGMKPEKEADFKKELAEVKKALEKL
ncbi:MAG: flavodoxin family protein [Candidatus Bathyarchaeia archaeon]|jgi:flavodoxin